MFIKRPTPEPRNSEPVFNQLESFRRERRLLTGLFFIAALVPLYIAVDSSNMMSSDILPLIPPLGVALAIVSVIAVIELYRSMMRKLISLHGTYSLVDRQNRIDPLTGALSRSCFLDAYEDALARYRKRGSVALVVIDVDHFKQINDGFGHPAGDQVLEFCALVAKSAFHNATVGRLGGDEFAVFFAHEEEISESYIEQACEAFLASLRDGLFLNHRRQTLSASLGVSVAPRDDTNMRVLLSYADMALYNTKRNGRAGWTLFRKDILGDMRQERFLERELRAAILLRQLSVVYQPIVTGDGELNSLEALVRWQNPVRGMISPAEFIPVAEKSNLIHELGLYVLNQVCADMAGLPKVPVNVNVSARQLRLNEFKRDYLDVLETHGVEAQRVILEITESSQLEMSEKLISRIGDLRAAGFRIALDDFGLGYSEFNQLRTLPFDIVKIDKSFIQNIGLDRVTDVFVSAVVQIAEHLDRSVVAEGIETEADGTRAAVAGCRLFQGYHYEAPVGREVLMQRYGDREAVAEVA
ncbi:MAG: bifunctional diguanylate cyclase/phosphodiesterase [Oricola sp.]